MRRALALLSIVLTVGYFALQASPASAATPNDFVSRINGLRASKGLSALAVNGTLASQCQTWAEHMASVNTISHNPQLASTPGNWSKVGENVGTGGTVDAIFNAYVASPEHYRNMVDPDFNSIGVGVAMGSDGRIYTCNDFAVYPMAKSTPAKAATTPTTAAAKAPVTTVKPVATTTHTTPTTAAAKAPEATTTTAAPVSSAVAATSTATPTPGPVLPAPSVRIMSGLQEVGSIETQG